jgi:hypothetical protein
MLTLFYFKILNQISLSWMVIYDPSELSLGICLMRIRLLGAYRT